MDINNIYSLLKSANIIKDSSDILEHKITRLSDPGENYMSDIYKLSLTINQNDVKANKNSERVFELVVKSPAAFHLDMDVSIFTTSIFKSEIYWYSEILPLLDRFQKEFGLDGFTNYFPKYYGSRLSLDGESREIDKDGIILLEYLEDYQNISKQIGFDLQTTESIIKVLAKFHSSSIAYKLTSRDKFDKLIVPRIGLIMNTSPELFDFESGPYNYADILAHLDAMPNNFTDIQRSNLEKSLKNHCFNVPAPTGPWAGISHSDFWVNNIMINKHDPTIIKFIDFQVLKYTSVLGDLAFFLILSVQHDVLIEHLDELLELYYKEFISNLHKFNISNAEEIFSYEDYLKEFGSQIRNGELSHAMYISFVMYQEKPPSYEDQVQITTKLKPTEMHKKRMLQMAELCVERNWV